MKNKKWEKYLNYAYHFIFHNIPIHLICLVLSVFPTCTTMNYIRGALVRPFLGKCGRRFQLGKGVIINHPELLYIGVNCYISHYCYVQARGTVTLQDSVVIGPFSTIASSNHIIKDGMVTNKGISRPICIGAGTWCGANVTITAGTNIGKSVIVGAGAVVTKDLEPLVKAYGIPAQPYFKCSKSILDRKCE